MRVVFRFLMLVFALVVSPQAVADVFHLANGGRIEAELLNPQESPRTSYLLQTPDGARLKLDSGQVERVVVQSPAEKSYEQFLSRLPDTKEAHWDAAQRCEKAGLSEQRVFHLEQVIRLDPEHSDARYALGYSRVGGEWVRPDEVMRRRGYVRWGNAWRLPQEVALEKVSDAVDEKTVEWRKNIRRWRDWVIKGREKSNEGRQEILHIQDPLAVIPLVELLLKDKEPQLLRLMYIEPLAAIGGNEALAAFVRVTLQDRDAQVREKCLEKLVESQSKGAVGAFAKRLSDDENLIVNRAAYALERMKDPDATAALIEALITEHKQVVGSSGMTPTFSGDGGAGLSMGGGQKVIKRKVKNESVLRALVTLHPGVTFAFDQNRWRGWWAEQNRPKNIVSLRRGP